MEADLEADRVLTGVLTNLPNAPISSNFTSLVLQAVDREAAVSARQGGVAEWLRNLLRRPASGLAWTGAAAAILFIGLNQYSAHQRAQLANNELVNSVVQISSAAALPDPRVFQDFDVIQGLGQMPPADDAELIRVLDQ